ncbi:MAG: FMN-binding protein [Clostridia bacterium]|nr:FMN-binding protein [Clostridia bacterium]
MKKGGILSGALALLAITLVAGLLLSAVHEWTLDPIAKADREAKEAAYRQVYSGAAYEEMEDGIEQLSAFNEALSAGQYDDEEISYRRTRVEEALLVQNEAGQTTGYVLTASSQRGYGGEIRLALGIAPDGTIQGMRVLSHSETAGFGARCEDPEYADTFVGDASPQDVDAITGATYITHAIREAVGAALCFVRATVGEEVSAA